MGDDAIVGDDTNDGIITAGRKHDRTGRDDARGVVMIRAIRSSGGRAG